MFTRASFSVTVNSTPQLLPIATTAMNSTIDSILHSTHIRAKRVCVNSRSKRVRVNGEASVHTLYTSEARKIIQSNTQWHRGVSTSMYIHTKRYQRYLDAMVRRCAAGNMVRRCAAGNTSVRKSDKYELIISEPSCQLPFG